MQAEIHAGRSVRLVLWAGLSITAFILYTCGGESGKGGELGITRQSINRCPRVPTKPLADDPQGACPLTICIFFGRPATLLW